MTPKEKAIELFTKMKGFRVKHSHTKKCVKILIDEILKLSFNNNEETIYWQNVKLELENL